MRSTFLTTGPDVSYENNSREKMDEKYSKYNIVTVVTLPRHNTLRDSTQSAHQIGFYGS